MKAEKSFLLVVLGSALIFLGCNSKELTRGRARNLLEASSDFAPGNSSWNIDTNAFQCGIKKGLWADKPYRGYTPADNMKPFIASLMMNQVVLAKPMKREINEITGITDAPSLLGPNTKIVTYTWHWQTDSFKRDYPSDLVECLGGLSKNPVKADIAMKLYDDGWRIER